jgi:hypothetical protein
MGFPRGLFTTDPGLNNIPASAETGNPMRNDLADADDEIDLLDQPVNKDGGSSLCFSKVDQLG